MSFADLMGGVAGVHKKLAALPGAPRIDADFRRSTAGMLPEDVVEAYNNRGVFGKTASGEPIRATMSTKSQRNEPIVAKGRMPLDGFLRLDPESKAPTSMNAGSRTDRAPEISWLPEMISSRKPLTKSFQDRIKAGFNDPTRPYDPPSMLEFYSMNVVPSMRSTGKEWYHDVPGKGKEMYALAYDLAKAGGHGNSIEHLTDVNKVRRLGNVLSHGMAHRGLGGIAPFDEAAYSSGRSAIPQLQEVVDPGNESDWARMLLDPDSRQALSELGTKDRPGADLASWSDDQLMGLMLTREAQLASAGGPKSGSRLAPLRILDPNVSVDDPASLARIALPNVQRHPGSLFGAFGPSTIGRQLTTEETLARMIREGVTPDEIVEDMIKRAPEGGYKGRYQSGGLVKKAAKSVAQMTSELGSKSATRGLKPLNLSDEALAKALGLDVKDVPQVLPQKQRTQNLNQFAKPSAVKQRVYHGTPYGESIVEDKQFAHYSPDASEIHWFSGSPKQAEGYTEKYMGDDDDLAAIFPSYIQVQKPLEVPFNMNDPIDSGFWKYTQDLGFNRSDFNEWRKENDKAPTRKVWHVVNSPQFKAAAERKGYDGVSVKEGEYDTYGVFDPARIKSQFNEGTYDTKNSDMGKKKGGLVAALQS
jgi:hypothetical protein